MKVLQLFVSYIAVLIVFGMTLMHQDFLCKADPSLRTYRSNETDMLALLAIKAQITRDPMLTMASWNTSSHFCKWKGVSCSHLHQRVTMLNLRSQSLTGYISPSIGNLSFLRVVDLSNNSFRGEVPREIGHLFRLQELFLTDNSLEGLLPANLSGCVDMRILYLQNNNFIGQVPIELGSLSNLVLLSLSENSLMGSIPASFGNLSSLEVLSASFNNLEGSIPESIGRLKTLKNLSLDSNMLSGSIPLSIYNLSLLASLSIPNNTLQGSLPSNAFLTLPNIEVFNARDNRFSGVIPVSVSNASKLKWFDLRLNNFFGEVPANLGRLQNLYRLGLSGNKLGLGSEKANDLSFISSLTNCSWLRILFIDENNFGGVLPSSTANLSTRLEYVSMSKNQIYGNIPPGIGNLHGLWSLDLSYNHLTGTIPESIGDLFKLQEAGFGGNRLSGKIPFSIGNLTLLNQLWLEDNNLEGSIPSSLGNCQHLAMLHLPGNALTGTVPREVIGLSSLTKSLNLSRNHLTGPLHSEVGNLKNLVELDISKNNLSGEIPGSLGSCTSLERLYLGGNLFGGSIPDSLSSLKGIEEIDLSQNNLSGKFLKEFGTFRFLWKLNLSFNDFEGEVPLTGVFGNASQVSLIGNEKLCGGIPELQLPACSKLRQPKMSLAVKIVISTVCGLFALSLVLLLSFLLICRRKERNRSSSSVFSRDPLLNVSYGDLLKATDGFCSETLIGTGSVGSVYKGILGAEQTAVAVKVLNLKKKGASKSFTAECEALRNIRHRNLVKLITACSGIDYRGDEFKALIYEFMQNGSLEPWLHSVPQTGNAVQNEPEALRLVQRLNVAIDVAASLDYLHNHYGSPIIHCDIKPSNILLDSNMTAHLGDFGIAKIILQCNVEKCADSASSVDIKGTIGYAAPEYGMGSRATSQGDVYSFGILLLEMFTGKRPTDDVFKDGSNLHKLVKMALQEGEVMEIVDVPLREEELSINVQQQLLISVLELGVACSEESPAERMNISSVVNRLQVIKGLLLRS